MNFIHISDFHLTGSNGKPSCKAERLSYDIKMELLKYLTDVIRRKSIKVILISGDIETEKPADLASILDLWNVAGAKTYAVFGCPGPHDTIEKRQMFSEQIKDRPHVVLFDKTKLVNDDQAGVSIWGHDADWNDKRFLNTFCKLEKVTCKYPSIFLTHRPVIQEHIEVMQSLGCNYYACGHHHCRRIEEISSTQVIGIPGHIFSTWDGSGKAWPTGYILGRIENGKPEIEWCMFPGAQTRRIWIDRFHGNNNQWKVGIDNAPIDRTEDILKYCMGDWLCYNGYSEYFRGQIDPDPTLVIRFIESILKLFPDDIFVTPSGGKVTKKTYGHQRIAYTARTILEGEHDLFGRNILFDEFVCRSYKQHPYVK